MNGFPGRVLLATDGSEDAALAARAASDLSRETGAELHLVHVWKSAPSTRFESSIRAQLEQDAENLLAGEAELIETGGGKVAGTHLRAGSAVDEVLGLAGELEAGLVVLGSRGRGTVKRVVMGSVSEGVVLHASCPVLVVRGGEAWPPARVVVGEDGSEDARRAGELAAVIGAHLGAGVLLVQGYPEPLATAEEERVANPRLVDDELRRAEKALLKRADELQGTLGSRPRIRVATGDAANLLVEASRENIPSLVAVGSRGLGRMGRLRLGSVSTKVLRAAEGPVLVYPSRER